MKLEVGYNHPFEVRYERVCLSVGSDVSIAFISDLHLCAYSNVHELITTINQLQPAIILLGGDYVDWPGGYRLLSELLSGISQRTNIFAIAGNHDKFWGTGRLKRMMHQYGVTWLENESLKIKIGSVTVRIDGGKPCSFEQEDADVNILFVHRPIDPTPHQHNYQLIFAGHLHGGQCVLWQTEKGLFPARLLYKWNILKATFGDCRYFISKGMGDTIPLRYNCKKDILFVEIS